MFSALDKYLWRLTYKWACWSHPKKPKRWIIGRYWGQYDRARNDRWVFGNRDTGAYLPKFEWTPIRRHTLDKGRASTDDPGLAGNWKQRRRKVRPPLDAHHVGLLDRQNGICPLCGEPLLRTTEPPNSPDGWESWFLRITRKALDGKLAVRLTYQHTAGSDRRTNLIHATCQRQQAARQRRPQPIST